MNSKLFTLDFKDFFKGLVVAVLTSAIVVIQQILDLGVLTFNWNQIGMSALAGAIAYLVKNYLTTSSGSMLGKESLLDEPIDDSTKPKPRPR